ncbi:hypothetical protein BTO20_06810 [Mycobacterium dioxanotrophicus]|uniref:Uncharacterized protein n=1 Tax=Mycobacterium dioxanotrophicus TaxID=482462 RepID=A0A1Y0BZI3_9MYCO|nr:hypothetical protein BTO20_06810 [Mycobacterium dioxanotrophicus]
MLGPFDSLNLGVENRGLTVVVDREVEVSLLAIGVFNLESHQASLGLTFQDAFPCPFLAIVSGDAKSDNRSSKGGYGSDPLRHRAVVDLSVPPDTRRVTHREQDCEKNGLG